MVAFCEYRFYDIHESVLCDKVLVDTFGEYSHFVLTSSFFQSQGCSLVVTGVDGVLYGLDVFFVVFMELIYAVVSAFVSLGNLISENDVIACANECKVYFPVLAFMAFSLLGSWVFTCEGYLRLTTGWYARLFSLLLRGLRGR